MNKVFSAFIIAMFAFSGMIAVADHHEGHEGETAEQHADHAETKAAKKAAKHAKRKAKKKHVKPVKPTTKEEVPSLDTAPADVAPAPADQE